MKNKNIPYFKTSAKVDRNLRNSLKTGWMTTGPIVKKFEEELSEYIGVKNVVALNSCTAGLHLSLAAQNIKRGDYVIVPNVTFVATAEVVEYFDAKVILCDIDPKTLCIDTIQLELIAKKLNGKLKFVIPVHFAGYGADMKKIFSLAKKYNFKIIEDAAHSLETISNNGKVGQGDHCTAFSFYANKNITTGGEGGAIATNNDRLAEKIRKLSLHGMSKDAWSRFSSKGKWFYEVDSLGYKYNLTDIAAGIGLQQLVDIESNHIKRKKIHYLYNDIFDSMPGISRYFYDNKYKHAYHLYIINIKKSHWRISRNQLIEKLNEKNIGTSVHYIPLHMMPYYKNKYGYAEKDFKNSCTYFESCISLPMYPELKKADILYIKEIFLSLYKDYKNDTHD